VRERGERSERQWRERAAVRKLFERERNTLLMKEDRGKEELHPVGSGKEKSHLKYILWGEGVMSCVT